MSNIYYNTPMDDLISYDSIQQMIVERKFNGADITQVIDDVYHIYEVASRIQASTNPRLYYDLFQQLIKTYGH
jgi:hypothetical protein